MKKIYYKITVFAAAIVALLHVGANKQEDSEVSTDDFSWNDLNVTPRVYANVEDDSPPEPDPDPEPDPAPEPDPTTPDPDPPPRPPSNPPSAPDPGPTPAPSSSGGGSGSGSSGGGCFTEGTLIDLPEKEYKEIQDIKVGDQVVSFDEQTRETSTQTVLNIFKHDDTAEEILCINDSLQVTPGHRFLTTNGWVAAGDLSEGDQVYCDSEKTIIIESIVSTGLYCNQDNPVFNFEVANNHTYIAGGMWVHNLKAGDAMCGCS